MSAFPATEVDTLVAIRELTIEIQARDRNLTAVDGISLDVCAGEILGLVGESGSGKTLTVLALMGLLQPPVRVASGSATFDNRDLLALSERQWRDLRGAQIAMIFQEPLTSLDPTFTIGFQLVETLRRHESVGRREARRRATETLGSVGIGSAEKRMGSYPHELSGGMRQRVMIAMALLLRPKLLLADEPVTALDVTTQAQIVELLLELHRELGMTVIFISHDLGVVLDIAHRVAVMYAGEIVEVAQARTLLEDPAHPYTAGLLASKQSLLERRAEVAVMPGQIPELGARPPACRFAPRCPNRIAPCTEQHPSLEPARTGRLLRCLNPVGPGRQGAP